MFTKCQHDNKSELINRATDYFHCQIYLPRKGDYAKGFKSRPHRVSDYRRDNCEPVVPTDELYDLDPNAWVTVNGYNALVLNSRNLFIADIDFGDPRFCKHAGVQDLEAVTDTLQQLHLLDEQIDSIFHWNKFSEQSYRIYQTYGGCRVICTSIPFPRANHKFAYAADRLLRFLRSDPAYIELCTIQDCYRARLTAKPWRGEIETSHVCCIPREIGGEYVHPDLQEQIRLHDELTLPIWEDDDLMTEMA